MPSLGGITAWISIGDVVLAEYGTEVDDDQVKCYVEVPQGFPPSMPPTAGVTDSPSGSMSSPQHAPLPLSPALVPLEYAINWKIQDLTYTMVAVAKIDGALEIEKIHLGKGTITAAKNTQSIDSVPITDDWSKRRLLTFVKLHAAEHGSPPKEPIGSIQLSLYRSGRASLSSGFKTSATGFHTKTTPDPKSLIKETTVDGLYSKSHTGPNHFRSTKEGLDCAHA
ncbi:hypothetical protein DL93DRAFT_1352699 [Clavulina sp. PMI_390]|nr:hypothetical protein DL93DRAFT_1352699 [Clavulina sp. PMI_390]